MSDIPELLMPEGRPALLDGGMGRELRNRGVPIPDTIWSANALLVAKDTVLQIHKDYIEAGADIITTNTYGVIKSDLKKEGIEDKFVELNRLAGKLAITASRSSEEGVAVAASLPPLRGSYRPDLVGKFDELVPLYREQAEILEPYCDLFLCETMSLGEEARAAATAASEFGRPVWVSFTLPEDKSGQAAQRRDHRRGGGEAEGPAGVRHPGQLLRAREHRCRHAGAGEAGQGGRRLCQYLPAGARRTGRWRARSPRTGF